MLASRDRKRIREYIAEQNLMAAIELDERIGYSASSPPGSRIKAATVVEGTRNWLFTRILFWLYEVDSQWGKVYILRIAYCTEVARGAVRI